MKEQLKLPEWKHDQTVHQIRFDTELNRLERMRAKQEAAGDQTMVALIDAAILFYNAEHPR